MENAISTLKAAVSKPPASAGEIHELKKSEDMLDDCTPGDCLIYRRETILVGGNEKNIRRVYYHTTGPSSAYCNVGWVLDDDSDLCLLCNNMFTVMRGKHHCRVW